MDDSSLPSSCVPAFIEISQVLLLEFTEMVGVPQQSAFLLLDGALTYLRELASYFPFTDPTSSSKVYTKLVQIHMRAIGRKGLKLIKRHCQSVVPAVFNIIVHLQSRHTFYVNLRCKTAAGTPDPGSAILMYVEVLTTVSRKHGLFSMDVCHVGYMLHIPAALFQSFHQHRISKASRPSYSFMVLEEKNSRSKDGVNFCHVDHQFTINLFVACCQILCTIIRHRPSECKQCVAHLKAFVTILLNCLETVLENNKSTVNEGWFCWEVEEEVEINTAAIIPGSM
ncbi:hypothetical protein KIW84_070500 [Lathyrus oleraceus]|uniref:Nucleolar 27S pre-rRNA processing Urb2/Npa2 C-terminal domain-containing protein n=1 Tax=Pisum sativum TaxID=3888 RepID=A0A9D4VFV5_PEA|nr:hypothetical protein KIW84_070500 [Pisum sativum]